MKKKAVEKLLIFVVLIINVVYHALIVDIKNNDIHLVIHIILYVTYTVHILDNKNQKY